MRTATLRQLNNESSALARAAQAGEVVVITDRGRPIVDIVPHRGLPRGVCRADSDAMFERLRALGFGEFTDATLRRDIDEVIDADVYVDPYERGR